MQRGGYNHLSGFRALCVQALLQAIEDYKIPAFRSDCEEFLEEDSFGAISAILDFDREKLKEQMKCKYNASSKYKKKNWLNGSKRQ